MSGKRPVLPEADVRWPRKTYAPPVALARRVAYGLVLVVIVAMGTWLLRGGYTRTSGEPIGVLDALYFSTVSVTTTGYGDILPVSDAAKLFDATIVAASRV